MKPTPISAGERIVTIDIIRGFALLGIFLVNMPAFHSPGFMKQMYGLEEAYQGIDHWIDLFFTLLIDMKFYTIFSFLFGLGFYIFMSRADKKGLNVNRLFLRRIAGLFLFAAVHLIFLWFGDILHTYALTGIFLLFFYRRKVKTILVWAFSLLLLIHILMSVQLFLPSSVLIEVQEKITEKNTGKLEEYVEVYENANYMEWVSYRLEAEILPILANAPFVMFSVLAMFLFGLFAGKIGAFKSDTTHLRLIRQTQKWSLVLAIPFIVLLFLLKTGAVEWGIKTAPAIQLFTSLSGITLCFFYITSLALLLRNQKWQRRLRPLGYTGQMALTNYLLQTIICIILFLGFGLYGKVSLAAGTAIALLIYALQMIFSYLWMKKFSFGPFEWLWRAITYGKFQPLKKRTQGGTNENDQDQSAG